jgi:hypothetical protein
VRQINSRDSHHEFMYFRCEVKEHEVGIFTSDFLVPNKCLIPGAIMLVLVLLVHGTKTSR